MHDPTHDPSAGHLPALRTAPPPAPVPHGAYLPAPAEAYAPPPYVAPPPPQAQAKRAAHEWRDLLRRGQWLIVGSLLLALGLGVAYIILKPPTYTAHSVLLIDTSTPGRAAGTLVENMIGTPGTEERRALNQAIILQQSPAIARRTAERLAARADAAPRAVSVLYDDGERRTFEELARYLMKDVVSIAPAGDETDAIRIEAESGDPEEAALIARLYTEEYVAQSREAARGQIGQTRTFLQEQLAERRAELLEAEAALADYRTRNRAVDLTAQASTQIQDEARIQADLGRARVAVQVHRARINEIEQDLQGLQPRIEQRMASGAEAELARVDADIARIEGALQPYYRRNPGLRSGDRSQFPATAIADVERLEAELQGLQVERSRLSQQVTDEAFAAGGVSLGSPESGAYLTQLRRQLSDERAALRGAEAEVSALQGRLASASGELRGIPEQQARLAELERAQQTAARQVQTLENELEQATLAEETEFGVAQIVREAIPPTKPADPNPPLVLALALLLGGLGGFGLAFLRHRVDTTIYDPLDLKDYGFHVLAAVPDLGRVGTKRPHGGALLHGGLVTITDSLGTAAEAYRHLHAALSPTAHLGGLAAGGAPQAVLVTGPAAGAGASQTALNLAVAAAQADRRTLLIDADLRQPVVRDRLGLGSAPAYEGEGAQMNLVYWGTAVGNLYALTTRRPVESAAGLWSPAEFADLLARLREAFDFIVVDAPPALATADAALLAPYCDATVLVASADDTDAEQMAQAGTELQGAGALISGVVLNRFKPQRSAGFDSTYGVRFATHKPARRTRRRAQIAPSEPAVFADGAEIGVAERQPAPGRLAPALDPQPAFQEAIYQEQPLKAPAFEPAPPPAPSGDGFGRVPEAPSGDGYGRAAQPAPPPSTPPAAPSYPPPSIGFADRPAPPRPTPPASGTPRPDPPEPDFFGAYPDPPPNPDA